MMLALTTEDIDIGCGKDGSYSQPLSLSLYGISCLGYVHLKRTTSKISLYKILCSKISELKSKHWIQSSLIINIMCLSTTLTFIQNSQALLWNFPARLSEGEVQKRAFPQFSSAMLCLLRSDNH